MIRMPKGILGHLHCVTTLTAAVLISAAAPCHGTHAKVAELMSACNAEVRHQLLLSATAAGLDPSPDGYRLVASSGGVFATLPLHDPEKASAEDWRRGLKIGFVVFQHPAKSQTIPPGEYVLWARIVDRVLETYLIDLHHPEVRVRPLSSQLTSGCNNQPEPGEGFICLNLCSCGFTPGGGGAVSCYTITSCFAWNP